ncbi:BPSS1780 family membrane protein [Propionivibrio limicola]|uniref:BPSS1780 family membrane protein n=1 Tax=Propionivibrio limicola TaxID=167645 RepID=UPI0012921FB3|nr:BPSS1780 family membrane protein [Propionivibrio limicola]
MQALTLPASRGWRWLTDGFAIFRRKPFQLSVLVLGYWLAMALINAVPFIGQLLGFILIPAFSVSLMNACRAVDQGVEAPQPVLFSGFHAHLQALIQLGGVYCVFSIVVLGVTTLIDGGVLFQLVVLGQPPGEEAMASGSVMAAGQLALFLLLPIMMANWFAPVLVAWHGLPVVKSLFFSFIACLRNWRAFFVYTVAVIVVGALVPGFVLGLLKPAGGGELFSAAMTFFVIGVLLPTLYASFYVSYRDVFVIIDENV